MLGILERSRSLEGCDSDRKTGRNVLIIQVLGLGKLFWTGPEERKNSASSILIYGLGVFSVPEENEGRDMFNHCHFQDETNLR